MANTLYPKIKTALEKKLYDLSTENLKIVLVDNTYTYSATHQFLSDVPAGSRVVTTAALASVTVGTVAEGTVDAADPTTGSVAAGKTIVAAILYDDTPATEATKPLIAFIDHDQSAAAISFPTNGSTITLNIDPAGLLTL